MMYLLDTMVISELRKRRRRPGLVAWITSIAEANLFLSAVTIGEIELGIESQRRRNPQYATELESWLESVVRVYADRILPLDIAAARRWGRLAARIGNKGLDLAIAATALERGLTVVTRDVAHFQPTGVDVLNPFEPRSG